MADRARVRRAKSGHRGDPASIREGRLRMEKGGGEEEGRRRGGGGKEVQREMGIGNRKARDKPLTNQTKQE